MLRKLTANALNWMAHPHVLTELLPEQVVKDLSFPTLKEAIRFIHQPPRDIPLPELMGNNTLPQKRLVVEELVAHRLSLLRLKQAFQSHAGVVLAKQQALIDIFKRQLPFNLTNAQE